MKTTVSSLAERSSDDQAGTTVILVAASLVMLMGFAAVAVDLGAGFNERRQDQTGADIGVLAGAVELAAGPGFTAQAAVDQITGSIDTNIRTIPDGEWVACADPNALPVTAQSLGLSPATQCISFDTFEHVRVRLPNQATDLTFGQILGATSFSTSAAAEATLQQFPGEGSPPPFAVPSGFGGGDQVCLRTSSSGNPPPMKVGNGPSTPAGPGDAADDPDPCDDNVYDPSSEFFGLLDPWAYFYADGTIACKQNLNEYFIAGGIDHPISSFEPDYGAAGAPPVLLDGTGCSSAPESGANTIALKSGLTAQELRCGMLTAQAGGCGTNVSGPGGGGPTPVVPARLHSGPFVQSTHTFLGERMDNKPLWDFLVTPLPASSPAACSNLVGNLGSPSWDFYDKRDELIACLQDWSPASDDPLFTDDIWDTPRFAWVPYLHETDLSSSPVHINDFVPIYLQTLYTNVSGPFPTGSCDDAADTGPSNQWERHHAGQDGSCGRNNGNLDRLSGIVLDCGMLSPEVCEARPGPPTLTPGGAVTPIIELVK